MATSLQQVENRPTGRIYFGSEDDLHLLREVVGQNPYEDNARWNLIQVNIAQIIGKFISTRTLKDRVRNLVKKFLEKDRTLQFQSGIEEEITELDDLLRHIVDLINEFKQKKTTSCIKENASPKAAKRSRNDSSYQKGHMQRSLATSACTTLQESTEGQVFEIIAEGPNLDLDTIYNQVEIPSDKENYLKSDNIKLFEEPERNTNNEEQRNHQKSSPSARNILTPTRRRAASSLKQSTLAYLTKKNDRWYEIRSRELALQEREKALKEKQFELDKWEKTKRIEMEEKKTNMELDMYRNQQRLIEIALQRNA